MIEYLKAQNTTDGNVRRGWLVDARYFIDERHEGEEALKRGLAALNNTYLDIDRPMRTRHISVALYKVYTHFPDPSRVT